MSSDDTRLVPMSRRIRNLMADDADNYDDPLSREQRALVAAYDAARRANPDDQHINVPRGIAEDAATLLEDFADDEEGAPEDTDRHAARVVARRLRALADAHPNQEPT